MNNITVEKALYLLTKNRVIYLVEDDNIIGISWNTRPQNNFDEVYPIHVYNDSIGSTDTTYQEGIRMLNASPELWAKGDIK